MTLKKMIMVLVDEMRRNKASSNYSVKLGIDCKDEHDYYSGTICRILIDDTREIVFLEVSDRYELN